MWQVTAEHQRFDESAQWLLNRTVVDAATRDAIPAEARARAFWIAGAAQMDVVNDVYTELRKASDEGLGYEEFQRRVKPKLLQQWGGVEPPHRIRLIYRNATSAALNAGRYQQMRDPAVAKLRPFWLYDAVRPTPCPSEICTELDGKIFRADDPRVDSIYPPNHHGCQSGFRCIRRAEAERRGGPSAGTLEHAPQPGFGLSPALSKPWMPDAKGREPDLLVQLASKVEEEAQKPDPLADALKREERARRLKEQEEKLKQEQAAAREALAKRKAAMAAQKAAEDAARAAAVEAERVAKAAAERQAIEARKAAEEAKRLAEEAAAEAARLAAEKAAREAREAAEAAQRKAAEEAAARQAAIKAAEEAAAKKAAKAAEAARKAAQQAAEKEAEKARKLAERAKVSAEKAGKKTTAAANNAAAYKNANIRIDDLKTLKRVSTNVFGRELSPDDFRALAGISGDNIRYNVSTLGDNEVTLTGFVYGDDGSLVVKVSREYKRYISTGKRVAHHTLMEVAESTRGTGIGRQILENQTATYMKLGVTDIVTEAAWDGRYVWPRFGFELRDPSDLVKLKSGFGEWLQRSGAASAKDAEALLSGVNSIQDLALTKVGGRKVGREWLTSPDAPQIIDLEIKAEKAAKFASKQAEQAEAVAQAASR